MTDSSTIQKAQHQATEEKRDTSALNKDLTLTKLEAYFKIGLNLNRAVNQFNEKLRSDQTKGNRLTEERIARSTIQTWIDADEELRQKIDSWKDFPNILARSRWIQELHKGDWKASKEWLERREKDEFAPRAEITGADGKSLVISFDPALQGIIKQPEDYDDPASVPPTQQPAQDPQEHSEVQSS